MFFYSDERAEPFKGGKLPDATKGYLRHARNRLFLDFFATSPDFAEAAQARKEIVICERKQNYWRRQIGFDAAEAARGMTKLKAEWGK